jgi:RHS repeat-associated protein
VAPYYSLFERRRRDLGGFRGHNRVTDRSQTFSYDQLNRISTAQTTATYSSDSTHCWGQAFGFDASGDWSNLLTIGGVSSAYNGCTQSTLSVTVNASNQIVGDTYDAAGNLWVIPGTGGATYLYNAENQMTSTSNSSMSYIYDGDGNRVEKSGSKIYWMSGSEVLDETDTTGSVTNSSFNEYVFFGGDRIARRDSSGDVFYYLVDQVDSSRVIAEVPSGQTTATMCYDADFEPYGGEHAYINTCSQNYKFTGKERDPESGLDDFDARFYSSPFGRFMTPDWEAKPTDVPYANFGNPQSLNLYSYVQNNPTTMGDPDGHCLEDACIAESAAVFALYAYTTSPAGQQSIRNGINAILSTSSLVRNTFFSSGDTSKTTPAPQSNPAPGTQTSTGPTQAPSIPDDANVVRGGSGSAGGANSPEGIAAGTGMHPSGVTGFSAESAPGKSVEELSKGVPNAHIGCCKAGEVRAAGGDVVPTSGRSPNHVTVTGVSPAQGSQLLTPTIPNPSKVKPKVKPKDKPE